MINIENEQLFIFLFCPALHLFRFQTSSTLHPRWRKKNLTEVEISAELLADTLSDVPEDADSDIENDGDSSIIGNRQSRIVHRLPCYSGNEQCANKGDGDDDDETLDLAVSTWVKTDNAPNFGPCTGNPGVKQIPSAPTKVSQVTELFFGDTFFFDMLCEEMNLYYLQNQEKYVTGSKGLKWSDVTAVEMKKIFSNNYSNGASQER